MITSNLLRARFVNFRCTSKVATSAASASKRYYAQPQRGKPMSPQEVLDKRHPKGQNEALSSIIDGELDYDTDMGAASVNNVEAERRSEIAAKAAKLAKETAKDLSKHNYS
ncbi:hypothetical protein IWW36_005033 [Coemansia brasiliensis]|uniref:Uncharacterized protein n=1 Tax=Coemansia brasiliensis TaxID=2650707 RepID=A0A9W8IB08_9FUNG|nr:hypothetical protein IWW36_005033 [Coemansia brasiliensis]